MDHEPTPQRDSIEIIGFEPDVFPDDETLIESFNEDVRVGLSPYFTGELRPLAFPSARDVGRLLSDGELAAIPWEFEGVHDGVAFRQLQSEDPPRDVAFAGIHLIDRNGEDALRFLDEVGLLAQLGAVTSSRRIGRKPERSDPVVRSPETS